MNIILFIEFGGMLFTTWKGFCLGVNIEGFVMSNIMSKFEGIIVLFLL